MEIQFLLIDKKENSKANDVYKKEIRFKTNLFVSDNSYNTISRVAMKMLKPNSSESIIRKKLSTNECDTPSEYVIYMLEQFYLNIEKQITEDTNIDEVIGKINNVPDFNPQYN